MNRDALIELVRIKLDDRVTPYLWSDAFLLAALNDAVREASERALLIEDHSTTAVTQLSVSAGSRFAPMHSSIIHVLSAITIDSNRALNPTSPVELHRQYGSSWHANTTASDVSHYYIVGKNLAVYPLPASTVTIKLQVHRRPLVDEELVDATDVPAIPEEYHRSLVDWVLSEAWSVPDSDARNDRMALQAAARFDLSFGRKLSAKAATMRDRALVRTAYMPGFTARSV